MFDNYYWTWRRLIFTCLAVIIAISFLAPDGICISFPFTVLGFSSGLNMCRSILCCHSLCKFICASVLSCLEVTVSLYLSTTSSSYNISAYSWALLTGLWWEGFDEYIPCSSECSKVSVLKFLCINYHLLQEGASLMKVE